MTVTITPHSDKRGNPGNLVSLVGADGNTYRQVIPAVTMVDSAGNAIGGTSASAPFYDTLVNMARQGSGLPTYRASGIGYAAYATPTDLLTISGSASKTVAILNLVIMPVATAGTVANLYWIKRSTANTGGTSTNPAPVAFESTDAAATAVVSLYTAAPTTGTPVGNISIVPNATVQPSTASPLFYNYSGPYTAGGSVAAPSAVVDLRKPITLHGVAESLCLNFNGAALPAGFSAAWFVEWVEY